MTDMIPLRYAKVASNIVGFSELRNNEYINVSYISGLGPAATASFGNTSGTVSEGDHTHAGYQSSSSELTSISNVTGTGFLKRTGANTWTIDSNTYITENQTITLSGDASGSGNTSITLTVDAIKGVSIPTLSNGILRYSSGSFTFDSTTIADNTKVVHNFGNESGLAGNKTWTGLHTFTNTTASTSSTTGAVLVYGGVGINGAVNTGLDSSFNSVLVGMSVGGVCMPTTNTPTAPVSGTVLYNTTLSGIPSYRKATGQFASLQRNCGHTNYAVWEPAAGSTTVYYLGPVAMTYTGGNLVTATMSALNARTRQPRARQQSATGTNRLVGQNTPTLVWTIGTGTGLGGFYYALKFMVGDNTVVTDSRMFFGLRSSISAPTNVEPSTLTNTIGIGKGASDTNLQIFFGGFSAQTPIDLGTDFNINNNTEAYLFELYSDPYDTDTVRYKVTRIGTPHVSEGTITAATSGLQLPSPSTLLAHSGFRATTATSGTVAYEVGHIYIDMLQ